ncbi:MAG: aromatic ring-hydroxylating dioxygenase subunit alpha [Alphaproteobacteria bacterium]
MPDSGRSPHPPAGVTGVDFRYYRDPEIFETEQRRIFSGPVWCYLGLEVEIPEAGDFISTHMGTVPVVLTRGKADALHGWVNRCAHKGATVCRAARGNARDGSFVCVYHQWAYDAEGNLAGAPFQRGIKGKGGYSAGFDKAAHGLQKVRVSAIAGMVFGTLGNDAPPLESFLGDVMCANIRRVMYRPIRVLGYARQMMAGNWKLYSENSRDSYHGGLLHLFYPTFGIYRPGQESKGETDATGFHNLFSGFKANQTVEYKNYSAEANREMAGAATLQDMRVIQFRPENPDNITLCIQSLFPSVVLQQIQNTLATRQVLPRAVDKTELIWTYFGYADDDAEMIRHRLRNMNLVGPAGFISMEDGEAVELCQTGAAASHDQQTFIAMGGGAEVAREFGPIGMDENGVRGFWKGYFSLMQE